MANIVFLFYGYILIMNGYDCLQLQSYVACYGSTGLDNFLRPACNTGEKMVVVGLSALAKEQSTSCPVEVTPFNVGSVSPTCCQYDAIDCSVLYSTSSYRTYYQNCNGNEQCTVQVSWTNTPCNDTVYLPRTNYMKMDFYCVSEQGLDPCSNLNTKDTRVFLWNSGYPSLPLSGSSSCTCSVEASCDSNIKVTALDLRLATTGSCGQSVSIIDGLSTSIFDCNSNNDYIPKILLTSSSHFIQIQIVDNLGSADGYYLILLEGITSGSELTLSCSSTAQTVPTTPASNLPQCPNDENTTLEPSIVSSSSTIISATSEFFETTSTIRPITTSPTVNFTDLTTVVHSSFGDTTSSSFSDTTVPAFSDNILSVSTMTLFSATAVPDTTSVETNSLANIVETTTGRTPVVTPTIPEDTLNSNTTVTEPTFVSLSWASTEKYIAATPVTTLSSLFETDDANHSMYFTFSTDATTNKFTTVSSSDTPKLSTTSLVIGVVVVLITLIAAILVCFLHRDKLKECCFKSKSSSKVDISEEADENPLYASIFIENLNIGNIENRLKPLQLPPITHRFPMPPASGNFEKRMFQNEERETKKKVKKKLSEKPSSSAHEQSLEANKREVKQKKAKNKKKLSKKLRKQEDSDLQFVHKEQNYTKSSFPATISDILANMKETTGARRQSIIDITDAQGKLEKSVVIDNSIDTTTHDKSHVCLPYET